MEIIFEKLLKTVYYDRSMHKDMFNDVMDLLFYFSYHNTETAKQLRPHLAYLAELIKWDIESAKVLA